MINHGKRRNLIGSPGHGAGSHTDWSNFELESHCELGKPVVALRVVEFGDELSVVLAIGCWKQLLALLLDERVVAVGSVARELRTCSDPCSEARIAVGVEAENLRLKIYIILCGYENHEKTK